MNPSIRILLYTYDRYEVLKKSLDTLFWNPGLEFKLWVVENGSTFSNLYGKGSGKEQLDYLISLYEQGKIETLILNDRNLGIHHPLNQLMALAKLQSKNPKIEPPEFTMISNDDMIYEPGWLLDTYNTFMDLEATEHVAVVSPFHCKYPNGALANEMGTIKTVSHNGRNYEIKKSVSGNTWFMRTKLWLETLDWYRTDHPTEGGDWDKLNILWKNNLMCAVTPEEMVHHNVDATGAGKFNRLGHW
jgi:GT2 family glycosyltransferase